jgi:hypothetical protein
MYVTKLIETLECCIESTYAEEREALLRIRRAAKFEIDLSDDALKTALDYARQMKDFDIFRLPFDECYFEMPFEDLDYRHAVLCWRVGEDVFARSYTVNHTAVSSGSCTFNPHSTFAKKGWDHWEYVFDGSGQNVELAQGAVMMGTSVIYAAVGALTLSGVSLERKTPSEKVNANRIKRKVEPYYSHTVVHVKLDPRVRSAVAVGHRHSDIPRRLHWRRGHIRRLASGVITQVKPALIGDRTKGVVTHEYRVAS